jgi:hypothetical protein
MARDALHFLKELSPSSGIANQVLGGLERRSTHNRSNR